MEIIDWMMGIGFLIFCACAGISLLIASITFCHYYWII